MSRISGWWFPHRTPYDGLPLAGSGVARCSHRFRQSLADSAPAAILNDSGINTRGVEKKCMQARHPPSLGEPFSLSPSLSGHLSRSSSFSPAPRAGLALSLAPAVHATADTELHRLLFPPRGHPNAFPPLSTTPCWHSRRNNADHRRTQPNGMIDSRSRAFLHVNHAVTRRCSRV